VDEGRGALQGAESFDKAELRGEEMAAVGHPYAYTKWIHGCLTGRILLMTTAPS